MSKKKIVMARIVAIEEVVSSSYAEQDPSTRTLCALTAEVLPPVRARDRVARR